MATITINTPLRAVTVAGGERGWFHGFFQHDGVGVGVVAVIEMEDGTVKYFHPDSVKFRIPYTKEILNND